MKSAIVILTLLLASHPVVARAPGAGKPTKPVTHQVVIDKMKFVPAALTIKPGDSVVWVNNDVRDHTVDAADGSFSSGNIGPGASFTQSFTKAGNHGYACSLHPRMRGTIAVK
ncbi:MAG TPA: cupredoxin family copper-binding protein [Tepidisphaeraceae bacterium]